MTGRHSRIRCGGFSIVSAIFLMVVLSSLAAYMVTVGGVQRATTSFSILGARAYYAGQSGLEWAGYRVINTGNCNGPPASIDGFSMSISCVGPDTHTENGSTVNVFVVTSIAEFGSFGDPDFVSRRFQATVSTSPP